MYNPYLSPTTDPPPSNVPLTDSPTQKSAQKKVQRKASFLSKLSLDSLDSGDVLLALILLFLALDGEEYEVIITLALLLLMGFEDSP